MIELHIKAAAWEVIDATGPNGPAKVLLLRDPQSGITIHAPFDESPARELAAKLSGSSVVVARGLPPQL